MLKHTLFSLGLALALPCVGAWAQDETSKPADTAAQSQPTDQPSMITLGEFHSPLHEFVSHQAHEITELSMQVDAAKAENRPDVARTLTHLIRDHVLLMDAGRNVLGQRNEVSTPVTMFSTAPMPASLAEMIHHDLEAHQKALEDGQRLLANATTPEERNIYRRAGQVTQRHLDWLRQMDQGQRVDLGFFGPTMPLSRIAGSFQEARGSTGRAHRTRTRRHRR